jgi:hypothetical protein
MANDKPLEALPASYRGCALQVQSIRGLEFHGF